jgi:hypothetical protein
MRCWVFPPNLCGTAIPWPSRLPSGYVAPNRRTPARASGQTGCQRWGVGKVLSRLLRRRPLLEEGPSLSVDPTMSVNRTVDRTVSTSGGWRSTLQKARVSFDEERCQSLAASGSGGWQTASGISAANAAAYLSIQSSASPSERGSPAGVQPFEMLRARSRMETMPTSVRPSMTGDVGTHRRASCPSPHPRWRQG